MMNSCHATGFNMQLKSNHLERHRAGCGLVKGPHPPSRRAMYCVSQPGLYGPK